MADVSSAPSSDAMEETLGRLSKKAGVKATMVLDRSTGAILRTSGNVSSIRVPKPIQPSSSSGSSSLLPSQMAVSLGALGDDVNNGLPPLPDENQVAEELASLVWNFVGRAGGLVQELDGEDELKFLRLRTKKQELVIVPDPKYLLIVVHDTPPA